MSWKMAERVGSSWTGPHQTSYWASKNCLSKLFLLWSLRRHSWHPGKCLDRGWQVPVNFGISCSSCYPSPSSPLAGSHRDSFPHSWYNLLKLGRTIRILPSKNWSWHVLIYLVVHWGWFQEAGHYFNPHSPSNVPGTGPKRFKRVK